MRNTHFETSKYGNKSSQGSCQREISHMPSKVLRICHIHYTSTIYRQIELKPTLLTLKKFTKSSSKAPLHTTSLQYSCVISLKKHALAREIIFSQLTFI